MERPTILATRGSALALAQANLILEQCRAAFPRLRFELKIIKTTGDKLQRAAMAQTGGSLPKGLFTKELEVAVLKGQADIAVHSLKDLPTDLPAGLRLAATPKRADVRDALVFRDADFIENSKLKTQNSELSDWSPGQSELRGFAPHTALTDFPKGATFATSSTRRKAQLLTQRPDLNVVEIRGNVATRLQKAADRAELDATVLALAGLTRLHFSVKPDGKLEGDAVPDGLLATILEVDMMLPCVGQGAIGLEIRAEDGRVAAICERLNTMGGGCQSPVAAFAEVIGDKVHLRAVSFRDGPVRRAETRLPLKEAATLGEQVAAQLK
jgi:hydroxymethylbilane synthase